jgi:hypothetical protein
MFHIRRCLAECWVSTKVPGRGSFVGWRITSRFPTSVATFNISSVSRLCFYSTRCRSLKELPIHTEFVIFLLAYFQKMKMGLSNHHPVYVCVCVCLSVYVSPTSDFWTDRWIFVKFGRHVLPFKETSTSHMLISLLQSCQKWRTFKF